MSDEPVSPPEPVPGAEEMPIPSPAGAEVPMADCSLLIDVGSAWTKASLVAHANGRWRVVAHAAQPSDWPRAELVRSLAAALRPNADPAFADHLETLIADGARIVCRTPARPGRIALAAVAHDVSAAAARQAAESAGWLVVEEATADDGRSLVVRLEALRDADPDAWLVVGGFDDGDPAPALELAALAAARGPDAEAPLVWAGSSAGETAVRELVGERLQVAPNASPRPGVRDPEPLRAHLETLLQGMVEPRGVRRLAPIAFRRAIGAVARGTGLTVVGVDIGARYATWVRADAAGRPAGRVFAAGGMASGQLVAGGMASRVGRHLAHAIDDLAVADVLQNLRTRPAALPQTEDELAITQAAARVRLEQMATQEGGIEGVDLVVAAGRTLAAAPTPSQAMAMLSTACARSGSPSSPSTPPTCSARSARSRTASSRMHSPRSWATRSSRSGRRSSAGACAPGRPRCASPSGARDGPRSSSWCGPVRSSATRSLVARAPSSRSSSPPACRWAAPGAVPACAPRSPAVPPASSSTPATFRRPSRDGPMTAGRCSPAGGTRSPSTRSRRDERGAPPRGAAARRGGRRRRRPRRQR